MELNDFLFPVEERPLYECNYDLDYKDEESIMADIAKGAYSKIDGHKGIYRTDTNKLISIVSSNYKLRTNAEIFDNTLGVLDKNGIKYMLDPMSSLNANSRMRCHIWLPQYTFKDNESPVFLSMFIQNSYDMTATFKFRFGAYRLICLNGAFIFYKQFMSGIFHKHTRNFFVDNIMLDIDKAVKTFPEFQKKIGQLQEAPLILAKMKPVVEKIMGRTFTLFMIRESRWNKLNTYYDLYNELTWYVTHKVPPAQKEIYFEKISKAFTV